MGTPLVTSLGHAGLRIDAPGLRLLCDPWVSPSGAFLASWFPYPDNAHLAGAPVLDADWVALSHEHLDHLDRDFLAGLPDTTRVVIPRYPAPLLRNRLLRCGVGHVIEVDPWQRLELNDRGDWLTVIPETSPMCHDSGVLVVAGGRSVLHANDARLTVAQCRRAADEAGGELDLMAVQMSGASWHPICYEYPEQDIARIGADKRRSKFRAVTRLLRSVQPRLALPYAGPPCFLDDELFRHNRWIEEPGVFPDQQQAQEWLEQYLPKQRTARLLPGDVLDLETGHVTQDPHWTGFSYSDRDAYLESYRRRRRPAIAAARASFPPPADDGALARRFVRHFERLAGLNDYFLHRIDMVVRFDVLGPGGGVWDVHLRPGGFQVDLSGGAGEVHYGFRVESRWIAPVLAGEMGWEDLLLSLRFSAWRTPDIYNDYLVGLLKHADAEALSAIERFETERDPSERFVVSDGLAAYEVPRYCPHAGEDLREGAVVHDGVLRCLGHNFEFDLSSGECRNARCAPLSARLLDRTE